ncbi:hypothetical protein ACFWV1_33040 [Streptomyces sp. NPDC058700]|uniref:hypothetical protein n=1 Tax=unclassified Streptomyces TaxID=2593676 RepID=UPI003658A339
MTGTPGTPTSEPQPTSAGPSRRVALAMLVVGFVALIAVVVLALTGFSICLVLDLDQSCTADELLRKDSTRSR